MIEQLFILPALQLESVYHYYITVHFPPRWSSLLRFHSLIGNDCSPTVSPAVPRLDFFLLGTDLVAFTSRNNPSVSVLAAWFVHDRCEELIRVSSIFLSMLDPGIKTYLLLVSRRATRGQNTLLDIGGSQVIQHGVIWQGEHRAIVLQWSRTVQDTFVQEKR